jgi:hypothetical protein
VCRLVCPVHSFCARLRWLFGLSFLSIGLVQDVFVLCKSGYTKTSAALDFISRLGSETENLVWSEISSSLADLASVWWEQPANVRMAINAFRRDIFGPVAERIGFEYHYDDADQRELRTTIIGTAAAVGHEPLSCSISIICAHRSMSGFISYISF